MQAAYGIARYADQPRHPLLAGSPPVPKRNQQDRLLIEGCRRNDPAAWDALINKYEKSVYKFAYTLCHNYDDAADIAGNVFLRLYENIHTFRHESNFTSWLF